MYRETNGQLYFVGDPCPLRLRWSTLYVLRRPSRGRCRGSIRSSGLLLHQGSPLPLVPAASPGPVPTVGRGLLVRRQLPPAYYDDRPRYAAINDAYAPLPYTRPVVDVQVAPPSVRGNLHRWTGLAGQRRGGRTARARLCGSAAAPARTGPADRRRHQPGWAAGGRRSHDRTPRDHRRPARPRPRTARGMARAAAFPRPRPPSGAGPLCAGPRPRHRAPVASRRAAAAGSEPSHCSAPTPMRGPAPNQPRRGPAPTQPGHAMGPPTRGPAPTALAKHDDRHR